MLTSFTDKLNYNYHQNAWVRPLNVMTIERVIFTELE